MLIYEPDITLSHHACKSQEGTLNVSFWLYQFWAERL